jgi:antitoxin component of RelBE/YafQ-DinJ toxin-antitoxin module
VLTLRLDGSVKNLAAAMAAGYGMTVAEYVESLVMRDAGEAGARP